jgi:hypothetical protein
MLNAPKTGTCYCGCGEYTNGWWAVGHDQRAITWLEKLETEPGNRAVHVLLAGYGPGNRNLLAAAREAGLTD